MKQITKLLSFIYYPIRNCILVAASAVMLVSCGGGTPLTVESNNQSLLNYINARHTSVEPAFIAGDVSTSGMRQNYEAAVQSFLNDSLTSARAHNSVLPIDSASVASLLGTYKAQDTAYALSAYYRAFALEGMPAAMASPHAQYLSWFSSVPTFFRRECAVEPQILNLCRGRLA